MAEFISGSVKIQGKNKIGGLVLDEEQLVFFQSSMSMGQMTGGIAGGLVGALIGAGIDKIREKRREKQTGGKTMADEPFFQSFDEKLRKQLAGVDTYMVVRRGEVAQITETWAGFSFQTNQGLVDVKSKVNKKKMRQWLSEHGYNVPVA